MKCPYLKKIIYKPLIMGGEYAEDIEQFCDCVKKECPFYYIAWENEELERCRKAEREAES